MNEYPPSLYRLANWIEARPESIVYFKLENNFLANFDLLRLFTRFANPILLPFFLIGLFETLRTRPKQVLILTLLPVVWLTIIGQDNPNGPLPLFLLIYTLASYGIFSLVNSKC